MTEQPAEPAATWLDADTVSSIIGDALSVVMDQTSLQAYCDGVRSYVEEHRPDLLWVDPDGLLPDEYRPTPAVVVGAAMMAHRLYTRRTTPMGVLGFSEDAATGVVRDDPDITRMLGIGRHGRFVFGGTGPVA